MKLDAGQSIAPVPWPIQSSPTASARKPTIKSNLRISLSSRALAAAVVQARGRVTLSLTHGKKQNSV
jgi:hypothetical protein